MIRASDIIGGVYGAWRLARRDPKGLIWFDDSVEGVWRSFWGPALVLPAFLILRALDGNFDDELVRSLMVELIAFVMGCVAFPLAVAHIAGGLDRVQFRNRYIVAYNWSAVIQMAVLLPISLAIHVFPGGGLAPLNLAATIVLLVYQAYIAHVALKVSPFSAGMLVVLDLMIGALIQMSADRVLG
ncbi:hypothetical protein A6A04_11130 [Paramagnetospirillum marisnigri]|uniref:Yip1 domain-containing protein n=1 Tax=Paramagnetospirillum marisnigri TaxID=1285242 RepID=A0A178MWK2_9PROT|nr:hypothetical protein [Paramagnetospirillum marisnigri]OAN55210.1 hypothetical protein A6A04_11130 [Paramagnetospirillum marisnigri]